MTGDFGARSWREDPVFMSKSDVVSANQCLFLATSAYIASWRAAKASDSEGQHVDEECIRHKHRRRSTL